MPRATSPKPASPPKTKYADRVLSFKRINPALIKPHPRNPRIHLEQQREVLRAMLEKFGIVDAVVVRQLGPDEYELINGHLRREEIAQDIPALVIKADAQTAAKLLATYDSIASIATVNQNAMKELLKAQHDIDARFKPAFDHLFTKLQSLEDYSKDLDLEKQFGTVEKKITTRTADEDIEEEEEEEERKTPKAPAAAAPPADTNLINLYYEESDHAEFVRILKKYRESQGSEMMPVPAAVLSIMKAVS